MPLTCHLSAVKHVMENVTVESRWMKQTTNTVNALGGVSSFDPVVNRGIALPGLPSGEKSVELSNDAAAHRVKMVTDTSIDTTRRSAKCSIQIDLQPV